ncbi:MAG: vitamin B12-dependent ribonucleotide reductase [Candidatus Hydrothermales bacterium]
MENKVKLHIEPFVTENARKVLEKRYLLRNEKGEVIETPKEMFERVAKAVAEVDKDYPYFRDRVNETEEKFYLMMSQGFFLPNSPTLMNAGTKMGQLSACFVLPVEDSMDGIFETLKHAALIHKTGGGTGFSFSRLRPKGDVVRTTGQIASGPVSFMKVFDSATEAVKQGGRRRGANMGILRVDHPDIEEFITCKDDVTKITNFNISVAITDEFMESLMRGKNEFNLINPRNGEVVRKVNPRDLWKKIIFQAWKNGEPGVIFIDRINKTHTLREMGEIEATNPCGEKPLLPYESCNLGSINLAKFYLGTPWYLENKRPAKYEEVRGRIDWQKLKEIVDLSVHFLDNVIDANTYPLEEIERVTKLTRKIGLGVMGFADLLYLLGIPYSSEEALKAGEEIMKFIQENAHRKSVEIGEIKGPFPAIDKSIFKGIKRRNSVVTTIAPTGSISMIADTSAGIEPNFALVYVKNVMGGERLLYVNKYFQQAAEETGFYSEELMETLSKFPTIKKFEEIPPYIREIFEVTFDISPQQHVKIQASFQKYVEDAVSKTINLPEEAKPEDVEKVYFLAYELGCKGITVYRWGSRPGQVYDTVKKEEDRKPKKIKPRPRPKVVSGKTYKIKSELGTVYITINEDEFGPHEVFIQLGKSGSSANALTEAIGRLISLAFRSGIDPIEIVDQLKGIRSIPTWDEGEVILSCPDGIGKILEKHIKGEQLGIFPEDKKQKRIIYEFDVKNINFITSGEICPECGSAMILAENCLTCPHCGFSKCD